MFLLSIRIKPQHKDFEATEKLVRDVAVKALMEACTHTPLSPDSICTDTRTVKNGDHMKGAVEIHIFTGAPDWLVLSTDNKIQRFVKSMKAKVPHLREEGVSVFVTDSQHYPA